MISNALSGPPKPASASATIGANQVSTDRPLPSETSIWSARCSVRFDALDELRRGIGRIERLVGIHGGGGVGVGRHLPAGEVDRLQAGAHLLHRLIARHRAERIDEIFLVNELPEPVGAHLGQRLADLDRAAQPLQRHPPNRGARCCRTGPGAPRGRGCKNRSCEGSFDLGHVAIGFREGRSRLTDLHCAAEDNEEIAEKVGINRVTLSCL